jgi:lipopolysaccharide transport system permease protein
LSTPAVTAAPETVISPPRRWVPVDLAELWGHRELVYFLAKRELQVRYAQSFFGVAWAVLQPLSLAFIFALFFGHFFRFGADLPIPYPIFAITGLVPWLFMANAVNNSAESLVQDSALISKVYFPRLALPLGKALSLLLDLAIALAVLVVMALLYGTGFASTFWLAPVFLLFGIVTAFAVGTWFAAVNVKYRDVGQVVPMLVQILFFLTPIIYPPTKVPDGLQYVLAINPMVSVIDGLRWALFGGGGAMNFPHGIFLVSLGSAVVILLGALVYFQRTEQYFADVV